MDASECQPENVWQLYPLTIAILSVSCAVGVLGNGLVLWMTFFRITRTVTTVWFSNLALADFVVLASLPISIHYVVRGEWPFSGWACKFYMAFLALNFFVSIYLLVLISVDRCILVFYPVWARNQRTVRRASWLAAAVWLLAAAACFPYLRFRDIMPSHGCNHCYFNFSLEKGRAGDTNPAASQRQMEVIILHFLLGFLVPVAIIGTCTHLIRTRLRQKGWVHTSRPKRLLVVLQMLILWATFSLGCLNSCLNPFLYVFIGRDFRERCFQSLSSTLAKAFGDEGFISHIVPEVKPSGNDGSGQVEVTNVPS
ncbi:PREDICTED: probable G-protein coupled receptor 32 [Chinchilla lanigera]|uniref:probable G-protein coupled receptor 32 n=1 Tax=Chinchilla lanigera TaxID=34839 RepID=UPI00038ED567|nr:PREDICTED: probable G-protein coupled receptor 32 [Chinchilla lanigera]